MGIITKVLEKRSNQSSLADPSQWLQSWFGGGTSSKAGSMVSEDSAMQITAVFACVRLKSETMASLPLSFYKTMKKGKEKADYHPLYRIIHDIPNDEMTSFEFRRMMAVNELLCGEAFAEIVRGSKTFDVMELWPIPNNVVTIYYYSKTNRIAFYRISLPDGGNRDLYPEQIWHWKGPGRDSTRRYKPVQLAREAMGLSLAAEEFGERFFSNGSNVGGIVEYDKALSDPAFERFKADVRNTYEGLGKANRLMFLEQGAKFHQVTIAPEQAQFLETRKFQVIEICRFFNIPPHMIMDLERATFSNIENQSIGFVVYSLRPWLVCIEQSAYKDLLLPNEQKKYFFRFNVDGLLRGDFKTRMEGYAQGIQNGIYSPNLVLELEDLETFEGGDIRMVNGNMIPVHLLEVYINKKLNEKGGNNLGSQDNSGKGATQ